MSPLLLLVIVLLIVYKLYEYYQDRPKNVPPGIPRLPIVGSYWHLLWGNYTYPHKTVEYYAKKLNSKLISCYFGPFFAVIANDYKTIKEVFTRDEFDGRLVESEILQARAFGKKLGIFFTDGQQWREQRRFALRHMRDFGFGRRQDKYEESVQDELLLLVDLLKNGPITEGETAICKDKEVLFPNVLFAYSGNTIWQVMFGERFDRLEHDKPRYLCESAMMFQRAADTSGGILFQRPILKYFGNLFGYRNIMKGNYNMVDLVKEHLKGLKESHDTDTDRGMIDRYLEALNKSDETSYFSEEQLIIAVVDFMFPALSALPVTVTHCIKFLMHNPEVKKKVQTEIDTVVGTGRFVTWEDRKNLPYTEATMREALRIETLTPLGVFHRCTKDTTLMGYNVPQNTVMVTNLAAMNHDPDLWGDPQNFRPERFLLENGQLDKDLSFPFGFGHRVCAGETFARYSLFGLFAILMQNFDFFFVEGQPNRLEDKLPGLIVTPKDFRIRVEPRS